MTAWYVAHNELVYAAMLTGFTLIAVCLGYFWWEATRAIEVPDPGAVAPEPERPYHWVDVEPWDGHTP